MVHSTSGFLQCHMLLVHLVAIPTNCHGMEYNFCRPNCIHFDFVCSGSVCTCDYILFELWSTLVRMDWRARCDCIISCILWILRIILHNGRIRCGRLCGGGTTGILLNSRWCVYLNTWFLSDVRQEDLIKFKFTNK
jgi:hypothetical protein